MSKVNIWPAIVCFSVLALGTCPVLKAQADRKTASSDGVNVEYFVFGSGTEAVLMAPGNGRSAKDLEGIAELISRSGYRVIAINPRGIGGSNGALEGATLFDLAADIWRVADDIGADKVHLLGKTFGQRVMRTASSMKPERVLSLIALGAGGEILPPPEIIDAYKRRDDPNTPRKELLKIVQMTDFAPGNADKAHLLLDGHFPELGTKQMEINNRTPDDVWPRGGTARMLIVQGLLDRVAVPQNAFNLATTRDDTTLIGLPGIGHNMIFEDPDLVADAVVLYLKMGQPKTGKE